MIRRPLLILMEVDAIDMAYTLNNKLFVIENELDKELNRYTWYQYVSSVIGDNKLYMESIKDIDNFILRYGFDIYKTAIALNNNFYHRKSRLKNRVTLMLNKGNCLFLTFTFTDIVLNTSNYDIRRRRVREFLKKYSDYYIANIDFGEDNGREHYHAIILCDYIDYTSWKYGALNGRKINDDSKSIDNVSKYVTKLTNHALKKSTGKSHFLIYGRKIKELTY